MGSKRIGAVSVELDDLIFALQRSGGASVYWQEVTSRISVDPRFRVSRVAPARRKRGVPALSRAEVFHSSHFRFSIAGGARNVSTVHDLNYELGFVTGGLGTRVNLLERRLSYFTADALICISENTRKDLLDVYPRLQGRCPIYVIHHGVSIPGPEGGGAEAGCDSPFVLYVGGRKAYKSFGTALQGFMASGVWRDGVKLLCTGAPFDDGERGQIASMGLEGSVSVVEHCTKARMFALYRAAHCLVYTSKYEGFGLPPLEAMTCRCPVVATRASSIPEVTGGAAILVSPGASDEVANAIVSLQDETLRADLVEKGTARAQLFSWDESVRKHADVYFAQARGVEPAWASLRGRS
jgi:mannosyltransferase